MISNIFNILAPTVNDWLQGNSCSTYANFFSCFNFYLTSKVVTVVHWTMVPLSCYN